MEVKLNECYKNNSPKRYSDGINLDATDRKLLQILQDDFPLTKQPWLEISNRTGISEGEVINRVKRLTDECVISNIGPKLDSSKIGLPAATLVALRVPKDRVDFVASIINQYRNVSHNYEREGKYNVWFTLTAPTGEELTERLNEIRQRAGVNEKDLLCLPTVKRFKINVRFQLV